MFKVGEIIVYGDGKIYTIVDKVERDYGRGSQLYFELKQSDIYKDNKNTSVFAPISKVEENSRYLLSKKEVLQLIDDFPKLEPFWINDCKQRKVVFHEYACSRDLRKTATLIKSIYFRNEELKDTNKSLTISDKMLMERLRYDLCIEISLVLKIDFKEVIPYINKRIGV